MRGEVRLQMALNLNLSVSAPFILPCVSVAVGVPHPSSLTQGKRIKTEQFTKQGFQI
jgi:hypothetical protein